MRRRLAVISGLAAHQRAVVHPRYQSRVGGSDRIDAAARGENLRRQLDGLAKVAGDLGKRGDKEVAEVVPFERIAAAEAMVEEPDQQVLFLAERHHAVAQVAGGQHVEAFAQAAGGAAVVGYRNHGGQVGDRPLNGGGLAGRGRHGGAARAAAWRAPCRRRWPPRAQAGPGSRFQGRKTAPGGPESRVGGLLES